MKQSAAFLLTSLTLAAACKKDDSLVPPDNVALRKDQNLLLATGVRVFADTIVVSICPKNAMCLLADNAFVSIRLAKGSQLQRVHLWAPISNYVRRPQANNDSASIDLDGSRYKIILRGGRYISGVPFAGEAVVQISKL